MTLRTPYLAILLSSVVAGVGHAQPAKSADVSTDEVEALARDGLAAYTAANYVKAIELFERAYAARQVPKLLYNIAKAYDKLGDSEKALAYFTRYADTDDNDPALRERAVGRIGELQEQLARRRREAEPPPAVTPPATPAPAPAPAPAPMSVEPTPAREAQAGWGAGKYTGSAFVVLGLASVGLGIKYARDASSLHDEFERETVQLEKEALADRVDSRALRADLCFLGGAVAVAAGVTLFILSGPSDTRETRRASVVPSVGTHEAGLVWTGAF